MGQTMSKSNRGTYPGLRVWQKRKTVHGWPVGFCALQDKENIEFLGVGFGFNLLVEQDLLGLWRHVLQS